MSKEISTKKRTIPRMFPVRGLLLEITTLQRKTQAGELDWTMKEEEMQPYPLVCWIQRLGMHARPSPAMENVQLSGHSG